jgi:acetylornithine aminotransferase
MQEDRLASLQERESRVLCNTYTRYPLDVIRASGTRLFDSAGREYLDLLAGISVCNLGHCHPELAGVMREQAEKLIHVSNLFYQEEQLELAERLLATCDLDRVFFCNSGAEANEAAIKLARACMQKVRGGEAYEIVTLQGSFHGRTLAALAATGQDKVKQGFDPLPDGFVIVPPEDPHALESALSERTAAVLLETIQGEGGVRPLSAEYLRQVQLMCRERSILFMIDEIQTGMGRTGAMWSYQNEGLDPDVVTVAKGLANGLPMGAVLAREETAAGFGPGAHATTFGGGALVSAVASRVLDIMERDGLCARAAEIGSFARSELSRLQRKYPDTVTQVRGAGLMLGVELAFPAQDVWRRLLEKGYVCNVTQQTVLRLLPALIMEKEEIADFVRALDEVLETS